MNIYKPKTIDCILSWICVLVLLGTCINPLRADAHEKGEDSIIELLEFKEAKVVDAVRLIVEHAGINVVATPDAAKKKVTLFLRNIRARQAVETLSKITGLWYRQDRETGVFRIMTTEEYQKDLVVFRDDQIRVLTLRHADALSVSEAIQGLYGDRVLFSRSGGGEEDFSGSGTFGGGTSGGLQSGQFSRPVGGQGGRTMSSSLSSGSTQNPKIDEALTADQIEALARGLKKNLRSEKGVSPDALKGVTGREELIYLNVDEMHNLIVIKTSDMKAMKEMEGLVKDLDLPTPQVLLEMKILELTLGDDFRSIFDMDFVAGRESAGPPTGQARNPLDPAGDAGTGRKNILGLGNFPLEGGTFIYQFLNNRLRARVQLFEENKRVNIVATPMILASNNRPAMLFIGEERVLTTGVSSDTVTPANGASFTVVRPVTEVRNVGTTLDITPRINSDQTVTLTITQDSSSVLPKSASIPVATAAGGVQEFFIDTVNTANVDGTVVAKDGLTVAIGGLIRTNVTDSVRKVPFLGDIPLLGTFFRREVEERQKAELILLITPHILTTLEEGEEATKERLNALSRHPFLKEGDAALQGFFDFVNIPGDAQPFSSKQGRDQDGRSPLVQTDTGDDPDSNPIGFPLFRDIKEEKVEGLR